MRNVIGCMAIVTFLCTGYALKDIGDIYIEDEKIISERDTYSLYKEEQCVEGQVYTGQLEFEGMDTLWDYEAREDMEVGFSYSLSVSQGKAKLVYVGPDNQVRTIVENEDKVTNASLHEAVLQMKKGRNRIKLVAMARAKIDLQVKVSEGTLNTLGC